MWFGPESQPKGSYLAEGDTYCFLNLIGNGLRGHEDPLMGDGAVEEPSFPIR